MPPFHLYNVPMPIAVALGSIFLASLAHEPARQKYMAITLAVAGGAYMDGGFGAWEFPAVVSVAICATRGLSQEKSRFGGYRAIAVGWLLHTALDVLHHVGERPMVGWIPTSSMECAITDTLLAIWMLGGAPGAFG